LFPGLNLLFYTFFAVAVFLVKDISLHAVMASGVVIALLFVPFRKVKGGLLPIALFLGFTFFSNLFYQTGRVLFLIASIALTDEGLRLAALRTVRVFEMVYAAKALTALTPLEDMIASLRRITTPLEHIGLPVQDFFTTTALTLRCFPVLMRKLQETYKESVEGKGAVTMKERLGLVSSFLVPLFVESLREPGKFFEQAGETQKT
jgi:energy-coupling factor transport system permease protein